MVLIFLVIGWVLGIAAASLFQLPSNVWMVALLVSLAYLAVFWRKPPLRLFHFALIAFVLGALRFQLALPDELDLALSEFNEQGRASLVGIVAAEPDVRESQMLVRVQVSKIQTDGVWLDTSGLALVSAPRDTPVAYGDEVQVDGAPATPPQFEDFAYRDYLARQNVFTLVRNARLYVITAEKHRDWMTPIYTVKRNAKLAIQQLLPEPSASLLTGILLGDDQGMPEELQEAFNNTNTAHVIAISGFNIAILVAVLAFVFRRPVDIFGAYVATKPSATKETRVGVTVSQILVTGVIILILVFYTMLVGASASVVRACIMGILALVALQLGRLSWAVTGLAIAAFLMTLINPYVLWDIGFQLSFLATLGLVVYAPRFKTWSEEQLLKRTSPERTRNILEFFRDGLVVTTAAFLVTAPLIVFYFHRVAPIGFLTNILILPAQPAIMILGGAATLLQMLANWLAPIPGLPLVIGGVSQVIAWGAFVFLQYTILVVQATAAIPFGSFDVGRVDAPLVILFYAALAVTTWLGVRRTVGVILSRVWIVVGLVAVAAIFVWVSVVGAPNSTNRVMFVDSSEGNAAFIRTADDYRVLINGTAEPNSLVSFLGSQLAPWDRRLDLVIATDLDDENLSALNAALERFEVGTVVEPQQPARPGVSYGKWRELSAAKGIAAHVAQTGTRVEAGEADIEVVAVTESDAILRVMMNGQSLLYAPGLTLAEQKALTESGRELEADVAVLPILLDKAFLEKVAPEQVVLFVGESEREQPTADTLKLLEGIRVLRTDTAGSITAILDGTEIKME